MFKNWFVGFNLREYSPNIRRFYLFAIPIFAGMALFLLLYNLYLIRLGFREDFIGEFTGVFALASGVVAIPTGILSDRLGRKPFLILATFCLTISHFGLCYATNESVLLILAFLGGSGAGFIFVNFIPFLGENAKPERRAQAIAMWMGIQMLTRMVVNLTGGALPDLMSYITGLSTDLPDPFRYALFIGAGCSVIAAIPLMGIRSQPSQPPKPEDSDSQKPPTPWKNLSIFTSISAGRGLAMGLSFPFFNVFFHEELNTATATIGIIFSLSLAIGFPSTLAAPGMLRRFGVSFTLIHVRAFGAIALAAMGLWLNFPFAVLLFLISTAIDSLTVPAEMAFATNTIPRPYWARLQSLRVTGYQVPSAIGSIVAGILIVTYGYWLAFLFAGIARLTSALVVLIIFGNQHTDDGFNM